MLMLILCYRDLQQPNNLNVNSKNLQNFADFTSPPAPAFSEESLKFRNLEYFMQSLVALLRPGDALPTSYWNETNMNFTLFFVFLLIIVRYYPKNYVIIR